MPTHLLATLLPFLSFHPASPPQGVPPSSSRTNEVCFDPCGVDSGPEGIELVNTGISSAPLSGYVLKAASARVLYTLPALSPPAMGYVVVQLGPVVSEDLDAGLGGGQGKLFTGLAGIDRLDKDAGGVVLIQGPNLTGAVSWCTTGAPSGSQYTLATASGHWPAGGYVDMAGGTPLQEGDSIGRSTGSADTNRRSGRGRSARRPSRTGARPSNLASITSPGRSRQRLWSRQRFYPRHGLRSGDIVRP